MFLNDKTAQTLKCDLNMKSFVKIGQTDRGCYSSRRCRQQHPEFVIVCTLAGRTKKAGGAEAPPVGL